MASIEKARKHKDPGFQWTRRTIAITAIFFVIAFPKIIAVYNPSIPIHIGYPELSKSFWIFGSAIDHIKWVHLQGLVITPLDTHLLSAIVGLYFGASMIRSR